MWRFCCRWSSVKISEVVITYDSFILFWPGGSFPKVSKVIVFPFVEMWRFCCRWSCIKVSEIGITDSSVFCFRLGEILSIVISFHWVCLETFKTSKIIVTSHRVYTSREVSKIFVVTRRVCPSRKVSEIIDIHGSICRLLRLDFFKKILILFGTALICIKSLKITKCPVHFRPWLHEVTKISILSLPNCVHGERIVW